MTELRNVFVPHERLFAEIGEFSMTRQEFAEEADINTLMARYERHGVMPAADGQPQYIDLVDVPDFHGAMQLMVDAEEAFMRLPATVRREFDNDPVRFVEFAVDGDNLSKLREWGLAAPEKAPDEPLSVRVISDKEPGPLDAG